MRTVSALALSLFVVSGCSNVGHASSKFQPREHYSEDLTIRPLANGKVVTSFAFTTILEGVSPRDPRDSENSAQHYTLFPLTLGQILREYAIAELHLSLNAGKWNYDAWGYPEQSSVGTGAELWAWMADGGPSSIDERWTGLRNALAGLFCASLGSLDDRRTSSPTSAFPLSSSLSLPISKSPLPHALRYATLPSEHVCTENLTPFLKLLPCKSRAGLAALLNPQRVFDADWHGIVVHVRSTERGVELRLGVQAVLDPVRRSGGKRRDWSFQSLFERTIDASCPVARSSIVHLIEPEDREHTLSPEPLSKNETVSVYDVASQIPLDVSMSWPSEHTFKYPLPPPAPLTPLSVKRTLHGSSQTRGVLSISLTNTDPADITLGYLETLPALVTLWMHTMRVDVDGVQRDDLISNITYHPPLLHPSTHHSPSNFQHHSPSLFQATLVVPAKSTLHLSIDLGKTFLKYTEHPPDAMRGWDLPSAVLFPVPVAVPVRAFDIVGDNTSSSSSGSIMNISSSFNGIRTLDRRMYTPTLLVDLPTPDFSMPYNVIILSCTLMTLVFGSVFNLLTRKWVIVKVEE